VTNVDIHPRAAADLLAHTDYLSDVSLPAALRFIEAFQGVLEQLRHFPESGAPSKRDSRLRIVRRDGYQFLYTYEIETGAVLMEIRSARMAGAD
jgi:plasmid stabilization system protein ParE